MAEFSILSIRFLVVEGEQSTVKAARKAVDPIVHFDERVSSHTGGNRYFWSEKKAIDGLVPDISGSVQEG